jgi:hypothetical protein
LNRGPHDLLAESKAFHIFEVFEPRSQAGRMRYLNAVRGVGAEHIKIAVLETPLAPIEDVANATVERMSAAAEATTKTKLRNIPVFNICPSPPPLHASPAQACSRLSAQCGSLQGARDGFQFCEHRYQ